jgi:DNA-binding transcriptional LysR family regulator
MNFAGVDLNLLRVFDAMMLERSTVRTGTRIGLSQPAVSAALGRLRQVVGDDLFVREGNRMVPTARALELETPVRAALRQLESTLGEAAGFDPAASSRTFVILGSDYFSTLLMPELAARIAPEAPRVKLQMLAWPTADLVRRLEDGVVDLAVDRDIGTPHWIAHRRLYRSFVQCVARRGHPMLARHGIAPGSRIPPEIFCGIPQVLMSMDGSTTGTIDPVLAKHGLARDVVMTVPHFHAVALAAAAGDLVGSLPVHFARHAAEVLGLDLYLPPYDPPLIDICLYWHRRLDRDPANCWLREHIARTLDLPSREPGQPPAPLVPLKPPAARHRS